MSGLVIYTFVIFIFSVIAIFFILKIRKLKKEISDLKNEKEQLQGEYRELSSKYDDSQNEIVKLIKEKQKLSAEKEEFLNALVGSKKDSSNLRDEITRLKDDIKNLNHEIRILNEEDIKGLQDKISEQKAQADELKNKHAEAIETINKKHEVDITNLNTVISQRDGQIDLLESDITLSKQAINSLIKDTTIDLSSFIENLEQTLKEGFQAENVLFSFERNIDMSNIFFFERKHNKSSETLIQNIWDDYRKQRKKDGTINGTNYSILMHETISSKTPTPAGIIAVSNPKNKDIIQSRIANIASYLEKITLFIYRKKLSETVPILIDNITEKHVFKSASSIEAGKDSFRTLCGELTDFIQNQTKIKAKHFYCNLLNETFEYNNATPDEEYQKLKLTFEQTREYLINNHPEINAQDDAINIGEIENLRRSICQDLIKKLTPEEKSNNLLNFPLILFDNEHFVTIGFISFEMETDMKLRNSDKEFIYFACRRIDKAFLRFIIKATEISNGFSELLTKFEENFEYTWLVFNSSQKWFPDPQRQEFCKRSIETLEHLLTYEKITPFNENEIKVIPKYIKDYLNTASDPDYEKLAIILNILTESSEVNRGYAIRFGNYMAKGMYELLYTGKDVHQKYLPLVEKCIEYDNEYLMAMIAGTLRRLINAKSLDALIDLLFTNRNKLKYYGFSHVLDKRFVKAYTNGMAITKWSKHKKIKELYEIIKKDFVNDANLKQKLLDISKSNSNRSLTIDIDRLAREVPTCANEIQLSEDELLNLIKKTINTPTEELKTEKILAKGKFPDAVKTIPINSPGKGLFFLIQKGTENSSLPEFIIISAKRDYNKNSDEVDKWIKSIKYSAVKLGYWPKGKV